MLTETPSLDERLTAREQLAIYADFYAVPPAQVRTRTAELLDAFQLADRGDDRVGGYSKGMRQRLALARALLHKPELLFLDEPTSGLDPVSTRQVHTLIREQARSGDHTVFLCTHNLEEAQRLCHRVAVLEHGRLVAIGAPAELGRNLWQGVRLEVETSPACVELTNRVLHDFAPAREVTLATDRPILTLALSDREQIPQLVELLVAAGAPIYRLDPQEPTLEDVYFALHGQFVSPAEREAMR